MKEEKEHILAIGRKRGFGMLEASSTVTGGSRKKRGSSDGGSTRSSKSNGGRVCANCGKMDSPEWRAGPTGQKTLCNACGLRWAKSQRQASESAPSTASGMSGVNGGGANSGLSPSEFSSFQAMDTDAWM